MVASTNSYINNYIKHEIIMDELKLEDYKVENSKGDYLLTIEGRVYIETEFYSFTITMSVSNKIYSLEDKVYDKIIDDYVRKYNPNVTSYSCKMKEILNEPTKLK